MTAYQIADWDLHFENDRSRTRDKCSFTCVPNKQHGMGFSRLMAEKDGAMIYGIFHLMLSAASQQSKPRNGWLTDDGHPAVSRKGVDGDQTETTTAAWDYADLSVKFRRPAAEIERALKVLCSEKIKWVIRHEINGLSVGGDSTGSDSPPTAPEEKRREEKRREEEQKRKALAALPVFFLEPDFAEAWGSWLTHLGQKRKPQTQITKERQLKKLSKIGKERAIACINRSIEAGWLGLFEDEKVAIEAASKPTPRFQMSDLERKAADEKLLKEAL